MPGAGVVHHIKPDAVVVILKAREPARIMTAIGDQVANRWHLQFAQRWVVQYNFYINDRNWGRMFVRICPYLPFSARICLNHALLAGVPMMFGHGTGSEMRQPLGYSMVGGLALSQVLTLYTTPVVYLYLSRMQARLQRRKSKPALVEVHATAAE
jgi:hypothetical protein